MKKIFVSAAALALPAAAIAAPGDTDTATGTATATVVAPIELDHDEGAALSFGSFVAGDSGTVVVNSDGAGTATGVKFVNDSATSADSFTVSGDSDRSFTIVTSSGSVFNGTLSMAFTTVPSSDLGTLDATGDGSFTVGGTLTVPAGQTAGDYSGTYNATVAYN